MESWTIYFRADESCTIYFYFLEFYRIRTRGLGTQIELNEVWSVFHDTTTLYAEEDWENKQAKDVWFLLCLLCVEDTEQKWSWMKFDLYFTTLQHLILQQDWEQTRS